MQLGEPEPVGLLDDHDRRVRDVDADLDHGRRHEHVELPRLEPSHQLAPLRRPTPATPSSPRSTPSWISACVPTTTCASPMSDLTEPVSRTHLTRSAVQIGSTVRK